MVAALAIASPAGADTTTSGDLRLASIGTFAAPIFITSPPSDLNRVFVVERGGTVQLIKNDGAPTTFLDLHSLVSTSGDGGLLSIAFPPDYGTSGLFYVFYSDAALCSGANCDDHVVEYRRSPSNPDVADVAPGRLVLSVPHQVSAIHHGGQLQFGPDGLLYIATGDGGGGGDAPGNAQSTTVLNGKLLRIDPRQSGAQAYTIPAGNPFAGPGDPGADEVYAYGLRNPFRFSFDHVTGDLTIGDVGQGLHEEVDFQPAGQGLGANFGWNVFEGFDRYNGSTATLGPNYVPPVLAYDHSPGGYCSVIGGYVVRDRDLSSLVGRYVYSDLCKAELRSAVLGLPLATDDRTLGTGSAPLSVSSVDTFGEDAFCRIYVASTGGAVYRLEPASPPASPLGCATVSGTILGHPFDGGSDAPDRTPPRVLDPSMARKRFAVGSRATAISARTARGTVFRYRLSERARMRIAIERLLPGRRVGRRCLPPAKAARPAGLRPAVGAWSARSSREQRLAHGRVLRPHRPRRAGARALPRGVARHGRRGQRVLAAVAVLHRAGRLSCRFTRRQLRAAATPRRRVRRSPANRDCARHSAGSPSASARTCARRPSAAAARRLESCAACRRHRPR